MMFLIKLSPRNRPTILGTPSTTRRIVRRLLTSSSIIEDPSSHENEKNFTHKIPIQPLDRVSSSTSWKSSSFPTQTKNFWGNDQQQHPNKKVSQHQQHHQHQHHQQQHQQQQQQHRRSTNHKNKKKKNHLEQKQELSTQFENESKLCGQHLDPQGTLLPTSTWIKLEGTLPISSLETVLDSIGKVLQYEQARGIVDLDAMWNPMQDATVPIIIATPHNRIEDWICAAHVILSPFGRPAGWHIQFQNRSMVHAILTHAQERTIYSAWAPLQISEYHYQPNNKNDNDDNNDNHDDGSDDSDDINDDHHDQFARKQIDHEQEQQPPLETPLAKDPNTKMIEPIMNQTSIVTDAMVRFENCPPTLTAEQLRYLLSRYDLASPSVYRWQGSVQGKIAPLMYIVIRAATMLLLLLLLML